jgi:hypothetical protein
MEWLVDVISEMGEDVGGDVHGLRREHRLDVKNGRW